MMKKSSLIIPIVAFLTMLVLSSGCTQKTSESVASNSEIIQTMADALQEGKQVDPVSSEFGEMTMDEAYQYQKKLADLVEKFRGPVCGYKVAYASKAAQEQFGMDEPARGPLYLVQRELSGSVLPMSAFSEIMLETEIAFVLGQRIDKPVQSVDALKKKVKSVHPAFDAGNFPYRVQDAKPTPQDMIAIGTGAHVFVLGPAVDPNAIVLKDLTLGLKRNGKMIRTSPANEVMGDPWNSILWCANHLVKDGLSLEPGMVVLCGTAAPAYKVKGEEIKGEYVGDCGALGQVHLTIQ